MTRRAPRSAMSAGRLRAAAAPAPTAAGGAEAPTVLLALANADVRCALRQRLAAQGFRVFATGDARVALEWTGRKTADIVVADVLLPGTRIAIPHVLRRRGRDRCPALVGLVNGQAHVDEALRAALGYDLLFSEDVPLAVLTRTLLELPQASRPA